MLSAYRTIGDNDVTRPANQMIEALQSNLQNVAFRFICDANQGNPSGFDPIAERKPGNFDLKHARRSDLWRGGRNTLSIPASPRFELPLSCSCRSSVTNFGFFCPVCPHVDIFGQSARVPGLA